MSDWDVAKRALQLMAERSVGRVIAEIEAREDAQVQALHKAMGR